MAVPRRTSLSSLPISMEEFNRWKNALISNEKRRKVLRLEFRKKLLQRCFPFSGKSRSQWKPYYSMRSMRVDCLGVGRCENGGCWIGGGGIFSTVLSKWERDNSTIRKLSTPIKCALQIRLILLSPILTHKLGSKKVNLQVIYILYTGNTCLFSRKFWIPRTSSLILGGGFKFSQMSAKCFHDDSNVLFLAPNCGDDRNWRICLQNIETTT